MLDINYVIGDATCPESDSDIIIIAHICNDVGAWGKGFVLAISKKWKEPELCFRNDEINGLGDIDLIEVEPNLFVCNMIAQHGISAINNIPPIRYDALRICLIKLRKYILERSFYSYSVNMPKIGSGLAGGDWNIIEKIIIEELCIYNIEVNIYTLK